MASQEERLRLIVEADTAKGEAGFDRLTGAAEKSQRSTEQLARSVSTAADNVAQSRLREQDAAGKLSVAEVRLQELRAGGTARASTLAAAEERVATAQRQLQAAIGGTTRATAELNAVQATATQRATLSANEAERMSRGSSAARDSLRGLTAAGGAFVGLGLVTAAREVATAYLDGARNAQRLANSTNSSTEQAGRLLGLVGALGLDYNDLLEIQAEFAQQAGSLDEVGVSLQKNADGTTNWTSTLEDTLVALQGIPDATERNRLGFQYFGEEGYKQLSQLVSSGKSVREALEQIGTPFSDEDVAAAQRFDAALLDFQLTASSAGRELAANLLPAVTGGLDALNGFIDVLSRVPASVGLTGVATAVLVANIDSVTAGAGRVRTGAVSAFNAVRGPIQALDGDASRLSKTVAGVKGAAAGAGGALLGVFGGGAGLAVTGVGIGLAAIFSDMERRKAAAAELTANMAELFTALGKGGGDAEYAQGALASLYAQLERLQASDGGFVDEAKAEALAEGLRSGEQAAQDAAEAMGVYETAQQEAGAASADLTELIAQGTTSGRDFEAAVRAAAAAQDAEAQASDTATAALEAYRNITTGAVDATLALVNSRYAMQNAGYAITEAIDRANKATDDSTTAVNEVDQAWTNVYTSILSGASLAADAAVTAADQAGTITGPLEEAQLRADGLIASLQESLNRPGLTEGARTEIQGIIDQLTVARDNGDIEATLTTLGLAEATGEIDSATEDRDTNIAVETRGGPAAIAYLDSITNSVRLATIRVESRNGPAVSAYLQSVAEQQRMALIMTESRGGPAVDAYLDSLASQSRLALINVETRGGPAVEAYLNNLARTRQATIQVRQQPVGAPVMPGAGPSGMGLRNASGPGAAALMAVGGGGNVTIQSMPITVQADSTGRVSAANLIRMGQQYSDAISAYERAGGNAGGIQRGRRR